MQRVVLEFTRSYLKAISSGAKGQKPLISCCEISKFENASNLEPLKKIISSLNIKHSQTVVIIPREQVITRLLKFPTANLSELASMVAISGKSQLPYPPEQVIFDFYLLEQSAGESLVNLVACHKDLIQEYRNRLKNVGIEPSAIVPSSWALGAWFNRFCRSVKASGLSLLLAFDADHTDLVLIKNEKILFSRSLPQTIGEISKSKDDVLVLFQEIDRSLSSFRRDFPAFELSSCVLAGPQEAEQFKTLIAEKLSVPIFFTNPLDQAFFPKSQDHKGVFAAGMLGCLFDEKELCINLLPPDARKAHSERNIVLELKNTFFLLVSVIVVMCAFFMLSIKRQERILDERKRAVSSFEAITKDAGLIESNIALIGQRLASRRKIALKLNEVFQDASETISFDSISFDHAKNELIVRGMASDTRDVLDYLSRLEKTSIWKKVELKFSARRVNAQGAKTAFEFALLGDIP
jgi:hypothetical protein